MTSETQPKYIAFLSYSHADRAWGEWLHTSLEGYRVPADLVGKTVRGRVVPSKLRPIFRDRYDLEAGHSLNEQIIEALQGASAMIVVCSPRSAKSAYVNDEIRRFKALGRADRVFPIIVEGEPGHPELDCFPPALRHAVGPDGRLTGESVEPLAADAREVGDGRELARLKLIAGLLGVDLDDLRRREQMDQRRQKRFWAGVAGVMAALAVGAAGAAFYARYQYEQNQTLLARTLSHAAGLVDTAVGNDRDYGVPIRATLGTMDKARDMLDDLRRLGDTSTLQARQRARLQMVFADSYGRMARNTDQLAAAVEARDILRTLVPEGSTDLPLQHDLSEAHRRVAVGYFDDGDYQSALGAVTEAMAIKLDVLGGPRASEPAWLYSLIDARLIQALSLRGLGNYTEASAALDGLLEFVAGLTATRTDDLELQKKIALIQSYRSGILIARRSFPAAQAAAEVGLATATSGWMRSQHRDWRVLLVKLGVNLGDAVRAQKGPKAAEVSYREAQGHGEELVRADPGNVGYRLEKALADIKVAEVRNVQGDRAAAERAFKAAVEAYEPVLQLDPEHLSTLRGMSEALNGLGNVEAERGRFADALKHRQRELELRQRVAGLQPGSRRMAIAVATAHGGVADVLIELDRFKQAESHARADLEARAVQLKETPSFDLPRRQHVGSIERYARVQEGLGDLAGALGSLVRAETERRALRDADPSSTQKQRNLANTLVLKASVHRAMTACGEARAVIAEADTLLGDALKEPPNETIAVDWTQQQKALRRLRAQIEAQCPLPAVAPGPGPTASQPEAGALPPASPAATSAPPASPAATNAPSASPATTNAPPASPATTNAPAATNAPPASPAATIALPASPAATSAPPASPAATSAPPASPAATSAPSASPAATSAPPASPAATNAPSASPAATSAPPASPAEGSAPPASPSSDAAPSPAR